MATIRCPKCGARAFDGRSHDTETYEEVCIPCERKQRSQEAAS